MPDSTLLGQVYPGPDSGGAPDFSGMDLNGVDWQAVNATLSLAFKAKAARLKDEEQAIRSQGQREFEQLVTGGATPEEALRRTAHKLYYNHPEHLATALRAAKPPMPVEPLTVESFYDPETKEKLGHAVRDPKTGALHSVNFLKNQQSLEEKAAAKRESDYNKEQQHFAERQFEKLSSQENAIRNAAAREKRPLTMDDMQRLAALGSQIRNAKSNALFFTTNAPAATSPKPPPPPPASGKELTEQLAAQFLQRAGGYKPGMTPQQRQAVKDKARQLATAEGYTF